MDKRQFRNYLVTAQVGVWALLFLVMFMTDMPYLGADWAAYYAFQTVFVMAIIVYTHYFKVFPLFIKRKKLVYFPLAFFLAASLVSISYYLDFFLVMGGEADDDSESLLEYFSYNFPIALLLMGVSTGYYFIDAWFQNIRKESQLKHQKLEAELNFLKSQINPHFLFNTLNNIYSYVQTGNEKSAPMLERLSSVLRFMVYDCLEDQVELNKELEAVDDLLEIYKMKNSGQRNIEFTIEGVRGYHLIAPLIIVNLVENACKHSDAISNPNGFIMVKVKVDAQDQCHCEVSNTVKTAKTNAKYGGVGHVNVVKRLDLQYGEQYKLITKNEEGVYSLKVSMPLERKL